MAIKIRLLAANVISGAGTTVLYEVLSPALGAIVSNVRLVNTAGAPITVNLYYRANSGSQLIQILDQKSIAAGDPLTVKPELTLATSAQIVLTVSGASIEYVVSGIEKL